MKYKDVFLSVNKPARYTGGEYNSCDYLKPRSLDFCLCFPEPYEVAMSNLGIKILYHMLNDREDTVCERCFFPWEDFSGELQKNNIPLFSIESKKSLKDFDILGFSIHHELCYTNILHMLMLANLPFYAKERNADMPLIIAGGPCTINPEPYAEFFDIVIIGEGEESLNSLCSLYIENKNETREEFLKKATNIEGVYVPSFAGIEYNSDNTIKSFDSGQEVKKAFVKDLDKAYFPQKFIVPSIEAVHDRAILELYRGCSNGCRFCQAGFLSRPMRHKTSDTVFAQAEQTLKCTGFEELSLSSLSTGDYPYLREVTEKLIPLKQKGVTFSLPSLRLSGFLRELAVADSLTFAPEAGTQRLRDVINKNISQQDIENAFTEAFSQGLKNLKLYFMCGLPTETEEDIDGICQTAIQAKKLYKQLKNGRINISVSCAVFIPKPLTPFQWEKFEEKQNVISKQNKIKQTLSREGIKFSYHSYDLSKLEAVFARGDRNLAKVIVKAYQNGCILDGWSEYFNFNKWLQAFEDCGIDLDFYLREKSEEEILPWDFINAGVSKKYLLKEKKNAYAQAITKDCRKGCNGCGANKGGDCSLC